MSELQQATNPEEKKIEDTPFVKVTSRRNRKNRILVSEIKSKLPLLSPSQRLPICLPTFEVDKVKTLRRLCEAQSDITTSQWFKTTLEKITTHFPGRPQNIVCFGIGNYSNCQISRYQLAFVLALKAEFIVNQITFHEPILTSGEIDLLKSLDIEVHSKNVEGKFELPGTNEHNLVYLPHCPKQLTNNFLWSNWSSNLRLSCLICNSFEELVDSTPRRFLEVDAQYILRVRDFTTEFNLPNTFRFGDIFNDTSLHLFTNLPKSSDDFWTPHEKPIYSLGATELITELESITLQS